MSLAKDLYKNLSISIVGYTEHLSLFRSQASSIFTSSHYLHSISTELLPCKSEYLHPLNNHLPIPHSGQVELAATILLSLYVNFTIITTLYKWHHKIYILFFTSILCCNSNFEVHPCYSKRKYFLPKMEWYSIYTHHILLIHSLSWHLRWIYPFTIKNNAVMMKMCTYFWKILPSVFLKTYQRWNCWIICRFNFHFWGTSTLLSRDLTSPPLCFWLTKLLSNVFSPLPPAPVPCHTMHSEQILGKLQEMVVLCQ